MYFKAGKKQHVEYIQQRQMTIPVSWSVVLIKEIYGIISVCNTSGGLLYAEISK